jgi:hypothetical protein
MVKIPMTVLRSSPEQLSRQDGESTAVLEQLFSMPMTGDGLLQEGNGVRPKSGMRLWARPF